MNDVGTNTLDVVVEPNRDRLRTSTVEANAQTSIPIVDVMLPSGRGSSHFIPHVNLSISGYEPDSSLRTSDMRYPSIEIGDPLIKWAQEISIMQEEDTLAEDPLMEMEDPW